MTLLRVQVEIPRDTQLPEDVTVNTWHFLAEGPASAAATRDPILAALTTFYNAIDDLLSPVLATPAKVKWYDVGALPPRVPVATNDLALVLGVTATPFPEEVALAVSYKAAIGSGQVAARRRGRIFLGPLAGGGQVVTNGRVVVGGGQVTQVANAAGALLASSKAQAGWDWAVYSPTAHAETPAIAPEAFAFPVDAGWVDNTYDTQRRRGPSPQLRTTF